ncbi:MAG: helix-turn-helix domain-containing protein [Bacteroidota bacterium]|nr:helix-turn-helix domain-containing protein [Bacteroidota bacterium]
MTKGKPQRRNEKAIATLASNIKKYRLDQKLTIQELANLMDVDYSQISRMERGIVNPNISIVFDIAEVLKVSPELLITTRTLI